MAIETIIYVVGAFLLGSFAICCWHVVLDKKIDFRDYKLYLGLVIATLGGIIINFYFPRSLKALFIMILFFIINYILYCRNVTKAILSVIVSEFIAVLCEFVFVIITLLFVEGNVETVSQNTNIYSTILISIGIPLLAFIFLKTLFPTKIYNYLYKTFNNMKQSNLIIYFIITIALISVFLIMTYMKLPSTISLVCNTILTFLYIIVIIKLANTQANFKAINNKYETSLTSLREYEGIMDKYRVANHENKNQLLTIRNMIKDNNKKSIDYIDKIIDNKIKDNENILGQTSKIPEGGFRATIYSKVCRMDEEGIDYELDIANDVKTVDLINLSDDTTLNACKIIGVFLDNAIQAVLNLEDRYITIELFIMDGNLCIDISNNYEGNLELDKMGNNRFTTKGKGHGYGLTLVNEILKEDKNLSNEKSVTRERFTQRLIIKI